MQETKLMAKKRAGGPNKSAAIRDYLKTKPDAGPTEVCKELKKKGIVVAPALVSNVKAALRGKKAGAKKKGKPGRKPGPKPGRKAAATDKVSISALVDAADFVEKVGGLDNAQALLKALGKLN
ncbi:MAG: hypothetical protein AAF743_11740 [Planctomycetota bacterium]